jgi:hypothetical protein
VKQFLRRKPIKRSFFEKVKFVPFINPALVLRHPAGDSILC